VSSVLFYFFLLLGLKYLLQIFHLDLRYSVCSIFFNSGALLVCLINFGQIKYETPNYLAADDPRKVGESTEADIVCIVDTQRSIRRGFYLHIRFLDIL